MIKTKTTKRVIPILVFSLLIVLTIFLIFSEINNKSDFIFSYIYYILSFIFYLDMMRLLDEVNKNQRLISLWFVLMIILTVTLILEYYLIVKIVILIQLIHVAVDIHKLILKYQEQHEQIKYISFHDELTGLHNRRYFEHKMDELDDESKIENISIIIGDINDLKIINDTRGHIAGDKHIKNIADIIKTEIREDDILARIGGDEFAVILYNTGYSECLEVVQRIKKAMQKSSTRTINMALGYAANTDVSESLQETFNRADQKMYENKKKLKAD